MSNPADYQNYLGSILNRLITRLHPIPNESGSSKGFVPESASLKMSPGDFDSLAVLGNTGVENNLKSSSGKRGENVKKKIINLEEREHLSNPSINQ